MTFALAVVGAAGSGKSTIARSIASRTGAIYLDKDSLAGPLVEAAMLAQGQPHDERETNAFYLAHLMPAEYTALFAVAADNLRLGSSVVLDAPFAAYLDQPDYFVDAAARAEWPSVPKTVLHVFASETTTQRRLAARGLPRDDAKINDWTAFWPKWGDLKISWTDISLLRIDSDMPPDIESIIAQL